jgi:hypothetical protein
MSNIISSNAKSVKNAKMIQIIVKENDLSISKNLSNYSCFDLLSATHEIVSKLFDKQTVAKAIEKLNTDSKSKSGKRAKSKTASSKATSSESTSTQTETKLAA